jgi:hypothetical protein
MGMTTGSFRNCAKLKGAVSISNGIPYFFRGPQYRKVAPRWDMLKMEKEDYDFQFSLILQKLDPQEVYWDLTLIGGPDAILLCWERPNIWCHRRLVAEWLEEALGIVITEYGMKRTDVLPYSALPLKPPKPQLELF